MSENTNDQSGAAPTPRRRRAASRPAGPPVADEIQTSDAAPGVEPAAPAADAPPAAPKRRRTTKKAAAAQATPEPVATPPAAAEATTAELAEPAAETPQPAPAAKKAARKRASKKTTAPAEPVALPVAEQDVEQVADPLLADSDIAAIAAIAEVVEASLASSWPEPAVAPLFPSVAPAPEVTQPAAAAPAVPLVPVVLFQAPDADAVPAPARSRRRRATSGATGVDATATVADEVAVPAVPAADTTLDAGDLADDGETPETAEAVEGDDGADDVARRRRRRGGRGRRSRTAGDTGDPVEGGAADLTHEAHAPIGDTSSDDVESTEDPGDEADDEGGSESTRRRRRRRRRTSGPDDAPVTAEDPERTVVHVRRPRGQSGQGGSGGSGRDDSDEVQSVRGSTRLEAKKQRRREGRDQGRRRVPLLTESEFLARREAVERTMVIRQTAKRTQVAVLEDGVLVEHYVDGGDNGAGMVGNIYLGRVQNVLPSMEAAFIDVTKGRNGVLYAGEVNWDAAGMEGQPRRIELALKSGDPVLVQVTKDPIGHKGARLTSQISLPGRFLVYVPEGSMTGISRKLPDKERARLKAVLKSVVPEGAGVIVRTAAEGASEADIAEDVARLQTQWEDILRKAKSAPPASIVHGEPDLMLKVVRDVFNEDFTRLVVAGSHAWDVVEPYVAGIAPDLADRLERWTDTRDVFSAHRVDEQLAKALDRKVWLPSGGSLVIDRTEAMVVVDVNTGRFTGKGSGNLEETVTRNNLEAAEEIVRQLRLRDLGGIIVIDFIDMVLESNRDLVMRRLLECLGRDRTKHQVAEVTSLGLVQMTRKRIGAGLLEAFSEPCEVCKGRGVRVSYEPVGSAPGGSSASTAQGSPGAPPSAAQAPREGSGRAERGRGRRDRSAAQSGSGTAEAVEEQPTAMTQDPVAMEDPVERHAHADAPRRVPPVLAPRGLAVAAPQSVGSVPTAVSSTPTPTPTPPTPLALPTPLAPAELGEPASDPGIEATDSGRPARRRRRATG